MPLAVLDWTANHVLAWAALTEGVPPRPVRLEGERDELALTLFLERRHARVGRAGVLQCRQLPHQVVQGFLPLLGEKRQWRYRRHVLGPQHALALVAGHVREKVTGAKKALLTVPGYLTDPQCALLRQTVQDAGLKVLGILRRSLSIGVASHWEHAWLNLGVLVDVDDYALTCTVLRPDPVDLHLVRQQSFPHLNLTVWRERLLHVVAQRCIRQHRRDPRAVAEADQLLFDQSDHLLDQLSQGQSVIVNVQVGHWVQQVQVTAAQAAAECGTLARPAAQAALTALAGVVKLAQAGGTIYITPEAARLPGLAHALYAASQNQVPVLMLRSAAQEAALEFAHRIDQGTLTACDSQTAAVPLAPPRWSGEAPHTLRFPGRQRQANS